MRLALIGFGNIASTLLDLLGRSEIRLAALTLLVRAERVEETLSCLDRDHPDLTGARGVVSDLPGLLAARPDLVVECAGHGAATALLPGVLRAGHDAVLVSIGALADNALHESLHAAALTGGARLILPAGAVGGIDLLAALRPAGGVSVRYRGIKPPAAWAGTPAEATADLDALTERWVFFTGTARQAATAYPKNANVAATLALAGAGFDSTQVDLIADPSAEGNIHEYDVVSPVTRFSMRIENAASRGNAKTSVATVYSVLREIANRVGPVAI